MRPVYPTIPARDSFLQHKKGVRSVAALGRPCCGPTFARTAGRPSYVWISITPPSHFAAGATSLAIAINSASSLSEAVISKRFVPSQVS